MSAFAFASQEVVGLAAPSARKKGSEAALDISGDGFDAALTQSEQETPMTSPPLEALPSIKIAAAADAPTLRPPQDFAPDSGLWGDLAALSGATGRAAPSALTAAGSAARDDAFPSAKNAAELLPTRAPQYFSSDGGLFRDLGALSSATGAALTAAASSAKRPLLDSFAKSPGSEVSSGGAGAQTAPAPPVAAHEKRASAPAWRAEGTPSISVLAQADERTPSAPAMSISPSAKPTPNRSTEARGNGGEKEAALAAKAEMTIPAPAGPLPAPPLIAAPSLPREQIASSQGDVRTDALAGPESDSVARIGAALASVNRLPAMRDGAERSSDEAEISLQTATTPTVHVVAQKTWLQPVSPVFSPGLNRLAAADRDALETPRAGVKAAIPEAGASAAPEMVVHAPVAGAGATSEPTTNFASLGGAAILREEDSNGATPAEMSSAISAAAPEHSTATPLAATPRRDLEITLAPKDLGGLAVRMKSVGDRLDLAFVADKGETARMISDRSGSLESQLQGAGLGLSGIEIHSASRQEAGPADGAPSNSGGAAGGARSDSDANSESAPQGRSFAGHNRQDRSHETGEKAGEKSVSDGGRGFYL